MTDKIRQAAPCICSTAYGITPETCGATTHHAVNHPEASSGVRLDGETPMNKLDELIAKVIDAGCSCDMMNGYRCGIHAPIAELRAILPDVERLVEALRLARKFVRGRLSYAPFGPQSLLDEIDAALALFNQPVAPKETK